MKQKKIVYPTSWPRPLYDFDSNPLTKETIELGRKLFNEPLLSKDNTISCNSCHIASAGFSDIGHAFSIGINDSIGDRNSPALINLAWASSFMWDGGVNHIEVQALAPLTHSAEMGENLNHVITKLSQTKSYPGLFERAFGTSEITGEYLLKAIAQFQLTLVSANSRYDKMIIGEEKFSLQEERGYLLFQESCTNCHAESLFTNGGFANNGLGLDYKLNDLGRMIITGYPTDSLLFKVPTLRNIEFSYPYMHDGRFVDLLEVLDHYSDGIVASPSLDKRLEKGIQFTPEEKLDVISFLLTLSDKQFLSNPDFIIPR